MKREQPGIPPGWKRPKDWDQVESDVMVAWPDHWKPAKMIEGRHEAKLENGGVVEVTIRNILIPNKEWRS